jgi:alpha-D-ribose 1-methylphosphonate 5-triphosphate synthase subunit PhnH
MANADAGTPPPAAAVTDDEGLRAQRTFNGLMRAMAEPGLIEKLVIPPGVPEALPGGLAAVAVTLADFETPLWLDEQLGSADEVTRYLRFATGTPIVGDPARAAFALVTRASAMPPFTWFSAGSDAYPDRSVTIVTEVQTWAAMQRFELTGPGIATARSFAAGPLPGDFENRMAHNGALFPRGIDLIMTSGDEVMALPRSARLRGTA